MRTSSRLGRAAVCCVFAGLGASLFGASGAGAELRQSDANPLSTNVPYLAWRGEHVRLVKCTGDLPASDDEVVAERAAATGADDIFVGLARTDVIVEDWSGDGDFKPTPAAGTIDVFLSPDDGICVKADVISQRAGLAAIKLLVTIDPGANDDDQAFIDLLTRSELFVAHQFLAGWMSLETPTLTELPLGGDAATLNEFRAGSDAANEGVARVTVTGTMPLGGGFSELGLGASISMPAGWPALATAMASDRNPDNENPRYRWDIHDDQTAVEGHPLYGAVNRADGIACNDEAASADLAPRGDAVDNCEGGLRFSRYFDADGPGGPLGPLQLGRTTADTVGPFDPQRPEETLLGDGAVTPDDAPMPAARVDVEIAANQGGTDLGGAGSLRKTDKGKVFSRDRAATANAGSGSTTAHNLYAPYYEQYIPATGDGSYLIGGSPVSGTDGPDQGNNYPGFLVGDGMGGEGDLADTDNRYDNWDIAHVFRTAIGGDSILNPAGDRCLRRTDERPVYRQTASGPQKVAVYTDEHGQTHVNYNPGTGFNFAGLGVVRDANGGCDLEGINLLGTASITAVARYPYQPVTDAPKPAAAPLAKRVTSRFTKFLAAFPKGGAAVNANVRIVVAHAQDIDGRPFANERVCFNNTSAAGTLKPYVPDEFNAGVIGGYDLRGSETLDGAQQDVKLVCMRTNAYGNAAVELLHSEGGRINVLAEFVEERLFRDLKVNFDGTPAPQVPTNPPAPTNPAPGMNGTVTPPAAGAAGTTAPPAAVTAATAKAVAQALGQASAGAVKGATAKGKKARLRYARMETSVKGKRSIVLRVDSAKKSARVTIVIRRSGKAAAKMTRSVATNRKVRISNVAAMKGARSVRVTVVG